MRSNDQRLVTTLQMHGQAFWRYRRHNDRLHIHSLIDGVDADSNTDIMSVRGN